MECCIWCKNYEDCKTKSVKENKKMACCEECEFYLKKCKVLREQYNVKRCIKCGAFIFSEEEITDSVDGGVIGCIFCKGVHWDITSTGQRRPRVELKY